MSLGIPGRVNIEHLAAYVSLLGAARVCQMN